jgi:hypothetical protein
MPADRLQDVRWPRLSASTAEKIYPGITAADMIEFHETI